ncbi:MAG: YggS family pyridoxal phosphate-dependent enzyme [Gemmatimonadota bacterium]
MSYPYLSARLADVRVRIAAACERAGRSAADVTIVAVTKTHPGEAVGSVQAAGLTDVGENRIQELEAKVAEIGRDAVRWHLIGHIQRNKARRAVELADLIHSVDSLRLARKLSQEAEKLGQVVDGLIQVNLSGEETKGGIEPPGEIEAFREICQLPGLRVLGLMTMAPFTNEREVLRSVFERTRALRDQAAESISGFEPRHLSMGMSNDYEIAVEEGSTLVRLGTVLLGERDE